MKNPFLFGAVVSDEHFINREDEVLSIAQSLLAGQNVICYSPRRYGKTSLMKKVMKILSSKGTLVFYIDMYSVTSLENLYNVYASSIAGSIKSPINSLIELIQRLLPSINPKIVFKNPGSPSVELTVPIPVLAKAETLRELFNSLEMYCGRKKKKGAVVFDEFQEIAALADGDRIEREMRSAFQHHKNVSYAFLGSKNHILKNIFKNKNRPFFNFGRHFDIDVISEEHWIRHIRNKFPSANKHAARILTLTQNHPYYTQMFLHYLWDYHKKGAPVDEPSLVVVSNEILQRDSMLFSEMWDTMSVRERNLLKAIAMEETNSIYEKGFLLKHNLGTAAIVQKAYMKLEKRDYVRKDASGRICFANPFFKTWIDRLSAGA